MLDRLEDILVHYEELQAELSTPDVTSDPKRFRKLMKEQSDLTPIVETYKEYKKNRQNIEESLALLEEESDEEMRELAKEELNDSKENVEKLEEKLKILLLPKDWPLPGHSIKLISDCADRILIYPPPHMVH